MNKINIILKYGTTVSFDFDGEIPDHLIPDQPTGLWTWLRTIVPAEHWRTMLVYVRSEEVAAITLTRP